MNATALLYGLIVILGLSLFLGYVVLVLTAWNLEGKVIDYNGESIPHATVTFSNYEETFKLITDEEGHYAIHNNILESIEEGKYHVRATKCINKVEFVGYEGDYKVEKKNAKFDIYFKNKDVIDVHQHVLDIMKRKFGDLRPTSSPSEPESAKMKYESKCETVKDTVDLKELGDYEIVLSEDKFNKNVVHIDLRYGGKLVEKGDLILNCSLFMGWTRPEGYHEELRNSIGLDEVKNTLTKDDRVIKIWTKYTWLESGDRFSDVIVSPLNVFNQRIGKNQGFFSFVDGFGYKFTDARPKPSGNEEGEGVVSSGPGLPECVEVDLSGLEEYSIHIQKKSMNKVCINLMKGEEIIEKAMCINDTNFWMNSGESISDLYRPKGMFPELKNTIGIVGVGKFIDENTIELSKDDGIIYVRNGEGCEGCTDPTISSKTAFDRNFVIVSREHKDDKEILYYKERWMLGSRYI
ncbi:MAG: carboxypeptidase-like regulatory domain-containing protein [Candidatus Altarchaeum sp.]|nr:carboxypeptidase-like regulatory domain-containing protein [Candidatus Altarchaeum sp.]